MKYIRTKDGRLDFLSTKHEWFLEDKEYIKENGIIKFADTIEELCDGYIFKDTRSNELHIAQKGKEDGIFILGAALFTETLRYFIETDEGLIYVAKMNEKGELELL